MSEYEVELYRIIGEMIRSKRLELGYTLEQVADKLNVIPKTLQRYETGERKIKISSIMELSKILGFDYNNFMMAAKQKLVSNEEGDTPLEANSYYINNELYDLAQKMFEDKDMRLLFDLKNSAKASELMAYAKYLKAQYDKENGL